MAIGTELEQRESSLTRQLQTHQAASAAQLSDLTSETSRLKHELDTALAQVRRTPVSRPMLRTILKDLRIFAYIARIGLRCAIDSGLLSTSLLK